MIADNLLNIELAEGVSNEDRERIMTEIVKLDGVSTVKRFDPDADTTELSGRRLRVEFRNNAQWAHLRQEIERIKGVIDTQVPPVYTIPWRTGLNGPSSPAP